MDFLIMHEIMIEIVVYLNNQTCYRIHQFAISDAGREHRKRTSTIRLDPRVSSACPRSRHAPSAMRHPANGTDVTELSIVMQILRSKD